MNSTVSADGRNEREIRDAQQDGSDGFQSLEGRHLLPENCMEYMLFVIDSKLEPKGASVGLEAVRRAALELTDQLTRDYMWQRDTFGLETKSDKGIMDNRPLYLLPTAGYLLTVMPPKDCRISTESRTMEIPLRMSG